MGAVREVVKPLVPAPPASLIAQPKTVPSALTLSVKRRVTHPAVKSADSTKPAVVVGADTRLLAPVGTDGGAAWSTTSAAAVSSLPADAVECRVLARVRAQTTVPASPVPAVKPVLAAIQVREVSPAAAMGAPASDVCRMKHCRRRLG